MNWPFAELKVRKRVYTEGAYRIYSEPVVRGTVYTLYYEGLAVKSHDTFEAALDTITRIRENAPSF